MGRLLTLEQNIGSAQMTPKMIMTKLDGLEEKQNSNLNIKKQSNHA